MTAGKNLNPEPLIEPAHLDPNRPQDVFGRNGLVPKVCSDVEATRGKMVMADTLIPPTGERIEPVPAAWTEDIAFAPNGAMYVAHRRDNQIIHVGAGGHALKRYGGPGRGPGEFKDVLSVAIGPDGLI